MLTEFCILSSLTKRWEQGFGGGNLRERDRLEDLGVDGRIILRRIFRKFVGGGVMDSIDVTRSRDRWRELVIAAMNLRV
jgi:hypothetical protein